ncbi:MAG: S8 family serine peptidase [Actinomycetota bacterium]
MRPRRLAIAVLATLSLILASPSAASGNTGAPVDPDLRSLIARVGPEGHIAAFVHFAPSVPYARGVEAIRDAGASVSADLPAGHLAYAFGPVAAFTALSARPEVTFLEHGGTEPLLLETATWATRVRTLYEPTGGLDLTVEDADGDLLNGQGVGIAIVDSGIDATHPDLRWAGFGEEDPKTIKNFKVLCTMPDLSDAGCMGGIVMEDVPDSDTTSGHGTHVAGISAGDGTASESDGDSTTTGDRMFRGVAPGSKLYGFGAGEGLSIFVPSAAAAFQWIYDNGLEQDPPIRVVNNSWGGTGAHNPDLAISKLSNALIQDKDITVVFAAGNAGGDGSAISTNPYANNPTPGLISAANYSDDETGNRDNALDDTSSRGKSDQPETWPDVSAPGTLINSTCKLATVACGGAGVTLHYPPFYTYLSGTSMAAPHTAGAAALLYQADPGITPAEVEDVLEDTAHKYTAGAPYEADPANPDDTSSFDKGHGLLDARLATLETLGLPDDFGTGTGAAGSLSTVIAEDASDDHPVDSLDIEEVTLTEDPGTGTVRVDWEVRGTSTPPAPGSSIRYLLYNSIDGVFRILGVQWTGTGDPTCSNDSTPGCVASLSENVFTAEYPAAELEASRGGELFDAFAATFVSPGALFTGGPFRGGGTEDRAPGGDGSTAVTHPARGEEHVFVAQEPALPDLTLGPSDISFTTRKEQGADVVTVVARIHNVGEAEASNVEVRFVANGSEIGRTTISSIPAGGSATTSQLWGSVKHQQGFHTVEVTADPDEEIEEEDDANNTAQRVVKVRGNKIRPR